MHIKSDQRSVMNKDVNNHLQLITLTIIVGLFFISSVALLRMNQSLQSLRFLGEEYEQILDSNPTQIAEGFFYLSPQTFALDIKEVKADTISENIIKRINSLEGKSNIVISFSNQKLKDQFYQFFSGENNIPDGLALAIQTRSRGIVSPGRICVLDACTENFIAIKAFGNKPNTLITKGSI